MEERKKAPGVVSRKNKKGVFLLGVEKPPELIADDSLICKKKKAAKSKDDLKDRSKYNVCVAWAREKISNFKVDERRKVI